MPFLEEDIFQELITNSPHFLDCHLLDFNFEEDPDAKDNSSGEIESMVRSNHGNYFEFEKDANQQ